jgi:uncharacterized protein involved in outer membrane biogenesis
VTQTPQRILITIAVLLLLLLLALILGVFTLESKWARSVVEQQLSERLEGRDVVIGSHSIDWGWPPVICAQDITIANTPWASHDSMLVLDEVTITPLMGALMRGKLGLRKLDLQRPQVHLARREDGSSNWAALMPESSAEEPTLLPQILTIKDGLLTYQDALLDTSITLDINTAVDSAGDRQLVVSAEGDWQDRPLQFQASGAAPLQIFDDDATYPLKLEGQLGDLQLAFSGVAQDPPQPRNLSGTLTASAPASADIAGLLGRPDLRVPEFTLQGLLARDGPRWTLKEIDLQAADSHLNGELMRQSGKTPRYEARLRVDQLDLNRWDVVEYLSDTKGKQAEGVQEIPLAEGLAEQLAALRGFYGFQGKLDLSVDQLSYAEETLSNVELQGSLNNNRMEIQQLQAIQGDGLVRLSGEVDFADKAVEGRMDVRFEEWHLGQALAAFGYGSLGTLQGDLQTHFVDGVLTLRDSTLAYDAPAQKLSVELNADMADIAGTGALGVHVEGSGMRFGEPFRFDLLLGPLLDMTAPAKPYPVKGTLASRDSHLKVDGTVTGPLQLVAVDAQFTLEGPNPARINQLTQLSLPSVPPYHIEGRLRWQDDILRLTNFTGGFGESDLAGDLRLRPGDRPKIWATLHSRNLNYDDLRPLWGSPPDIGPGGVASPRRQERMAREQAQSGRFFPDTLWSLDGLNRMDAVVDFSADHVNAKGLPLQELALELELHNGRLALLPLQFGLGGGTVTSDIRIDTQQSQVSGTLDASVRGVNLKPLLRVDFPDVASDSAGVLGGKVDFSFSGLSMADFMAGADGQLELAMSGGHLDMLAVEVLGIDAGEALVSYLTKADQVPIRCTYLRFESVQGQARLEQLFIDTDDSNFTGDGTIDLRTERINLEMESHSKDMGFFSGNSPVQLTGMLGQPEVSMTSPELLARGVASVIGLIVAPPLAILPWLNPGLGEGVGAGCSQVLEEYRTEP